MSVQRYRDISARLTEYGDDLNLKHKRKDHTLFHQAACAIEHLISCCKTKDSMVDHLREKPWRSATIAWTLFAITFLLLCGVLGAVFGG